MIAPEETNVIAAGTTNIFTCVAMGIPNPTITWWKDGAQVLTEDNISINVTILEIEGVVFVQSNLQICKIGDESTGEYQCVAEVPRLIDTADFVIFVQSRFPVIDYISPNMTIVTGTPVTLECIASGAPLPTITWFLDDIEAEGSVNVTIMEETQVNSTIELGPVDVSGVYTCEAESGLGVASAEVVITVQCM